MDGAPPHVVVQTAIFGAPSRIWRDKSSLFGKQILRCPRARWGSRIRVICRVVMDSSAERVGGPAQLVC